MTRTNALWLTISGAFMISVIVAAEIMRPDKYQPFMNQEAIIGAVRRAGGVVIEESTTVGTRYSVSFSGKDVDDAKVATVAELLGVIALRANGTGITKGTLNLPALKDLEWIDIAFTKIDADDISALGNHKRLSRIEMDVSQCTKKSLQVLAGIHTLKELSVLCSPNYAHLVWTYDSGPLKAWMDQVLREVNRPHQHGEAER